ncbi:MAG: dynamin family protein [Ilumatobacteraceae bacterium]
MKVCPGCAVTNDDASVECRSCGAVLDAAASSAAPGFPPPVMAPPRAPVGVPPMAPAPTPVAPATAALPPPIPSGSSGGPATAPPPLAPVTAAIELAERSGRTDLAVRLRSNRDQLECTSVTVAVVGEFKKGKSSLVNALVNAELCPADPVDATVAPIAVKFGEELGVRIARAGDEGAPAAAAGLVDVVRYGSEAGNEGNHLGVIRIDITVPRRILESGLVLLDTPGVGGLESATGVLNLAALEQASGVLFVTDCSQELTAPELAYLRAASERCPAIICVMTKLDLHLTAPDMAARNRRHLAEAGLDGIEVVAVSSALHLLAMTTGDLVLDRESGFGMLADALHTMIWQPARRRGLADAGEDLAELAGHLSLPIEAAQRATDSEQAASETIAALTEARDRVRQFRGSSAWWQRRLTEGMEELAKDLGRDLDATMTGLAATVDRRIDDDEAIDDLVFEGWVRKVAIERVVVHYEMIGRRAAALVDEIDQQFHTLDRAAALEIEAVVPTARLADVRVNADQRLLSDGVARRMVRSPRGYGGGGMVLVSSAVGIATTLPWIPLLALPFAGLLARRAYVDDRDRRRDAHQDDLKRQAAMYVDEIAGIIADDTGLTVERVHRQIRDHYAARAEQLERTLQQSIVSAERARAAEPSRVVPPGDRATVVDVASTARLLVGAPVPS